MSKSFPDELESDLRGAFAGSLLGFSLFGERTDPTQAGPWRGCVLSEKVDLEKLLAVRNLVARSERRGLFLDFFFTPEVLKNGLDAFPLEFLNMKLRHRTLIGKDFLEGLQVPPKALRTQVERELRGLALHLHTEIATGKEGAKALRLFADRTIPSFLVVFRGILWLTEKKVPEGADEVLARIQARFRLSTATSSLQSGALPSAPAERKALLNAFLEDVQSLVLSVDRLKS